MSHTKFFIRSVNRKSSLTFKKCRKPDAYHPFSIQCFRIFASSTVLHEHWKFRICTPWNDVKLCQRHTFVNTVVFRNIRKPLATKRYKSGKNKRKTEWHVQITKCRKFVSWIAECTIALLGKDQLMKKLRRVQEPRIPALWEGRRRRLSSANSGRWPCVVASFCCLQTIPEMSRDNVNIYHPLLSYQTKWWPVRCNIKICACMCITG